MHKQETVAAIATPLGTGGIGVVRISGSEAFAVAARFFRPFGGKAISDMAGYSGVLGRVFDAQGDLDEAILTVFRAPKSYTGEDVAEISCHGGMYLVQRVLRLCLENGAKPAPAGEFTRRAFLNGKLNLTQAEAVMDLIAAQSDQSVRAALSARDGALSKKTDAICQQLLSWAAHMGAWADYPEEEIPELENSQLLAGLEEAAKEMQALLATCDAGRILHEGVDTAIVGRPNVGKSTLMNLLSGTGRSIVTPIAGTTRDIVEQSVRVGEVVLNLADTAGIRETDDPVESIGVARSLERLERCDLVLAVLDRSLPLEEEDLQLLERVKDRPLIVVLNKADLAPQWQKNQLGVLPHVVEISAASGEGAQELAETIEALLGISQLDTAAPMLANERQRHCLREALEQVEEAKNALLMGHTLDAVGICMDCALDALLSLTGKRAADAVIDQVFASFCVGK